jgi:uncharacterized protein (TIGR03067 family)
MRRHGLITLTVVLLAAANLSAVADRPDKKKKKADPVQEELKKLEGVWDYAVSRGDLHVTIRGGVYTSTDSKGKVTLSARMKIDPTKSPKWLDMVYTAGAYQGTTLTALYDLKGDTLTLCIALPGNSRPTALQQQGGKYDLCTLKRRKAK